MATTAGPFAIAILTLTLPTLRAQCNTTWASELALAGADNLVTASAVWDPDGPGPATPQLVVVGGFEVVGSTWAPDIAAIDLAGGPWTSFGSGFGPLGIRDVLAMPNGDLVVGGRFSSAGGVAANNVALWDGSTWSPLGSGPGTGLGIEVNCLLRMPNGDIAVGGEHVFGNEGVAIWDGTTWTTVGGFNNPPGEVLDLALASNGDLIAVGSFGEVDGVLADNIARWDGTSWSDVGIGTNDVIRTVTVAANGEIYVGGDFTDAGGFPANRTACFDGTSWSALGIGPGGIVRTSLQTSSGDLLFGGSFQGAGGIATGSVAQWDGTNWLPIGAPSEPTFDLTELPNGDLFAACSITTAAWNMVRLSGFSWSPFVPGMDGLVRNVLPFANGDVVIAGKFTTVAGIPAENVAIRQGGVWSAMGNGLAGQAFALAQLPNGNIVAGGDFGTSPFGPRPGLMVWDGISWSPLGGGVTLTGFFDQVADLLTMPDGDLVVAGSYPSAGNSNIANLARWDGTTWSSFGSPTAIFGRVATLLLDTDGDLIIGGNFQIGGGANADSVARWNGSAWSGFGTGVVDVRCLALQPDGSLIAGGNFFALDYIARWNGTSWQTFGGGLSDVPYALTTLPNGDLLAGGTFNVAGSVFVNGVARWDGASWLPVDTGMNPTQLGGGDVFALATDASGDVLAGGQFHRAGSVGSAGLARLTTDCPASATPYGNGCAGSSGPHVLAADTRPWIGATFAATASGMPSLGVAFAAYGFQQISLPLANVLAEGQAGCDLLVTPDFLDLRLLSGGELQTELFLPNDASLVGTVVHHQVVPFEWDAMLQILAVTSTNGLTLTVGNF